MSQLMTYSMYLQYILYGNYKGELTQIQFLSIIKLESIIILIAIALKINYYRGITLRHSS